jgi:hypothetical protein
MTGLRIGKAEHFQVDSANLARSLLTRYKVAAEKSDIVWDAIALHDQGAIARRKQAKVRLVNAGVSGDFGAQLDLLARADVAAVLDAAPPWLTDVAIRMVHGIHFDNFVDDVKATDPFSGYR